MSRIIVAFDYFSPQYPLVNNQNFNRPITELEVDNWAYEFFNWVGGYECLPSVKLTEYDTFIYPIRLSLNLHDWLKNPEVDLLATTNMSLHTFNGIRGRNGFLFLDLGNESLFDDDILDPIHNYLKSKEIPLKKVILQTGNAKGKEYYKDYCFRKCIQEGLNISCLEYFEWLSSRLVAEHRNAKLTIIPKSMDFSNIQKTFLCLNRLHRWHRVNLLMLWNSSDLLTDSYYTMDSKSNFPEDSICDKNIWLNLIDVNLKTKFNISDKDIENLHKCLPLQLDEFDEASKMASLYGKIDTFYQSSLISIVTETNFENNDIFNTEKIFKPMVHRHPFILVGPHKALVNLKDMGYKTFSDFWDESYDDIEDPRERLIKIVEVCREIKKWDEITRKKFFYKSMVITTHNYDLLTSQYPNNMRHNFWHRFRDYIFYQNKN